MRHMSILPWTTATTTVPLSEICHMSNPPMCAAAYRTLIHDLIVTLPTTVSLGAHKDRISSVYIRVYSLAINHGMEKRVNIYVTDFFFHLIVLCLTCQHHMSCSMTHISSKLNNSHQDYICIIMEQICDRSMSCSKRYSLGQFRCPCRGQIIGLFSRIFISLPYLFNVST